ncbi:DUF3152 domain-containing protein [Actinomyces faecalis]|uniref:DUF3152 domain-containing protein n=1 Tax=Actinomyces faecalis TaxID=2722820 RepID=UPI001555B93C|nr:DUF3152 domain-containing protein [Actinomyces faecalis]
MRWRLHPLGRGGAVRLSVLLLIGVLAGALVLLRPVLALYEAQAALGVGTAQSTAPSAATTFPSPAAREVASPARDDPQAADPQPQQLDVPPVARTDELGIARSDTTGDGTWNVAGPIAPPASPRSGTHRYLLQVEGGTGLSADEIAPFVNAVLNDDRGWAGTDDVSFEQVQDPTQADFVLSIATPGTTDQRCAPLDTEGRWSCRQGATVNINADRWSYLVPWFPDAETYRAYLVNHEVGHWLGRGHLRCPGAGVKAPTMMQQSGGLDRCLANPWPAQDGQAG